jgi:hypothetical protein
MKISAIPSYKSLDLIVNKQAAKDYVMERQSINIYSQNA